MTTVHHVPHGYHADLTSAEINRPLSELDAAIETVIATGSGTATTLTASAGAGQASLTVASSAGFAVNDPIYVGNSAPVDSRIIATVSGMTITVTLNLANTYAIGTAVSKSPVELVMARGTFGTLGERIGRIESRVYDARMLGAKGDGTTDDTSAIQAAIDAAAVAGGTVYCPPGTYICSMLTMRSKVHVVGAGYEATVIKLANGTNDALIRTDGFLSLLGSNSGAGVAQWSMERLTLDGNRTNNSAGDGLQVYGFGYTLRDLRIREFADGGIRSEHSDDPGVPTPAYDCMEAHVENVKVHDCGASGILWNGPHDSNFIGVFVYACGGEGIWVQAKGMLRASNCHVYAVGGSPWYLEGDLYAVNCIGEGPGAGHPAVFVGHNDVHWTGGFVGGIEIYGAAACRIDTVFSGTGTAVLFTSDGGQNDISGRAFGFTNTWSGSPNGTTVMNIKTDVTTGWLSTAPAVPASAPVSVRNPFAVPVIVYVEAGTCTGFFVNGLQMSNSAGPYFIYLPALAFVSIVYSSVPTWHWFGV
jgi:Pectate lyase superfamily protein